MKTLSSFIRIILLTIVAFLCIKMSTNTSNSELFSDPVLWLVLAVMLLLICAVEITVESLKSVMFRTLSKEAQEEYTAEAEAKKERRKAWFDKLYHKLTGSKAIEEEDEIILDHNYDGIRELDNNLPPWWLYGFYITILFAVIYMAKYHIFNGDNQQEEYLKEVAAAKIEIEAYKRTAKNLVDVNTVTLLTEASDLSNGKKIFTERCIACHKADGGGGIGPNLTDEYWILGGGIKNIFKTVSEGGRDGKGMIAWKQDLKPLEIAQVASYVISLKGTTPAAPKAPEGEIWVDPDAEVIKEEINSKVKDTIVGTVQDTLNTAQ